MTTEQIRNKLLELHEQEHGYNIQMGKCHKKIRECEGKIKDSKKKIAKLAKLVSINMKYRNTLINKL